MPDIILRVRRTILHYNMLSRGETVVAAVSGGVDSTVMLHALLKLKEEFSLNIIVAHLNHNLRGRESQRDFRFVKKLSGGLGLAFEGKTLAKGELDAGLSLQEAAREKRYAFLREAAKAHGAKKIALGHNLDDQAETVLMRFLKGTSLSGLAGIPPVREGLIRPLIEVNRAEIELYAKEQGLKLVLDSSNLTDKYLRNKLRLRLIPLLKKEYNPNITGSLSRTASILSADDDFLEIEAQRAFDGARVKRWGGAVEFDRKKLTESHQALISRIFLIALRPFAVHDVSSLHVKSFHELVMGGRPNARVCLPEGVVILREYDRVFISAEPTQEALGFDMPLDVPGVTEIKGAGSLRASLLRKLPAAFKDKKDTAFFDFGLIEAAGPLRARRMRPGDRLVPLGMKGHKKLKDIFMDAKIPLALRRIIPVITAGEAVIWAAGVRQSEDFKVRGGAGKVLKLEFRRH